MPVAGWSPSVWLMVKPAAGRMNLPAGSTIDVFDARGKALVVYPDVLNSVGRQVSYMDVIASVDQRGQAMAERKGPDGVARIYGVTRLTAQPLYENTYLGVGIPMPFVLAGGIKIAYDLALLVTFRNTAADDRSVPV